MGTERRNLKGWFHTHKWTLNTGSGRRNSITLIHILESTGKIAKFEDLANLAEIVRCFRSEEANVAQLKDLERRIQEHAQTKLDLEKERRKLKSVLQKIKKREAELAMMDVNQVATLLTENTELKKKANKARQDAGKNKRELQKLQNTLAEETRDIARMRGLLEAGERDVDQKIKKFIASMKKLGIEVKESDLPSPSIRINLEGYNHKLEPILREDQRIPVVHHRRRLQLLDRLIRAERTVQSGAQI